MIKNENVKGNSNQKSTRKYFLKKLQKQKPKGRKINEFNNILIKYLSLELCRKNEYKV